jgi:hypothetical protein
VTEDAWRLTLPLCYGDRPVGKLSILGSCGGSQGLAEMQQMLEYLEPLEAEIGRIVEEAETQFEAGNPMVTRPAALSARPGVTPGAALSLPS